MASPFAKYQSEQVQQIAPGFVEAYGRAGAAIGQGIAGAASSVAKGMEVAEQKEIELAKQRSAIAPYLRSEVTNVQRSLDNGLLQVGKDGKVFITPGQEGNLDANKVGRAIDLYNQTDGGKKELKAADLAGVISTVQSYDTLEKQASDRVKAARDAKISELEYNSKVLGNAKTLSEGILQFATERRSLVDQLVASGDVAGANLASAEARALYDKAQSIAFDAYRSAGIPIDSYLTPTPVDAPARPAADAVGSGASTLYTVPDNSGFNASLAAFDARFKAGSTPAHAAEPDAIDKLAQEVGLSRESLIESSNSAGVTPEAYVNNLRGVAKYNAPPERVSLEDPAYSVPPAPPEEMRRQTRAAKAAFDKEQKAAADAPAVSVPAAPAPATAAAPTAAPVAVAPPSAVKQPAPTSRNLLLGTAPAVQPSGATGTTASSAAGAPATTITKPAYIEQAEKEIASLRTARQVYVDQAKSQRNAKLSVAGLTAGQLQNYEALAKAAESQALKIDDSITEKMKALTAERTREETGAISTTKLSMEQGKAMDDRFPDFGQGYMASGRAKAFKLYPDDPGRALGDTRIPGIKGEAKEITDTIGSIGSFMEGTMAIESAIDSRLEEGAGFFDRFTLTSTDYENIAKGNVGEKILLASMRKAIVSGGNFSDADRTFVLEAIASINTLDATKREEYFKALNKVMAGMVFKMYDGKLKSMGVERHLELLSPDERKEAVSPTETAFRQRFELNDNGQAASARNELTAIIGNAKKSNGYASSRSKAEAAVASFIDRAKTEAAARVPEATK
jgi:hypothetical protein